MVNGLNPCRGISYLFCVIVKVKVVFRKIAVCYWRFNYLSGSHLQSQEKSRRQMMVFMSLVLALIGKFCRDMIGRQNVKVVVIVRLLTLLLFSIRLFFVGFVWSHVSVVCKVQLALDIGSEVLVLRLCTSFLISVVVGSLCCKWHIQQSPSRFCV